jgi:hypothetical protein
MFCPISPGTPAIFRRQTHLSVPDLVKRWHDVEPHQFGRLGDDRVGLHRRHGGDLAVLGLVRCELRVCQRLCSGAIATAACRRGGEQGSKSRLTHLELVDVAGRVRVVEARTGTEVSQTLADRGPEDGDLGVSDEVIGLGDVVRCLTALRDISGRPE